MSDRPSISAVFPAYNDGGTIPSMVLRTLLTLRQISDDFEIIVTNDGSADYTGAVLDELARELPELRVIHHPQNKGYGHALRSGFAAATKDFVFYTDGDAQYDPGEMTLLVAEIQPDVDIVNGYKISRNDPWHRVIIGRIYHHLMRLLFGYPIRDVDCDFRLIRRHCFEAVELESPDGTLPLEMVKKWSDKGFKFVEVPVHHFHRVYGQSQFFNLPRLVKVVFEIIRLWWQLEVKQAHLHGPETTGRTLVRYARRLVSEPRLLGRMLAVGAIAYLGVGFLFTFFQLGWCVLDPTVRSMLSNTDPALGLQRTVQIWFYGLFLWPDALVRLLSDPTTACHWLGPVLGGLGELKGAGIP
jgi:glycosyltransferase involved in cell wall biosynthesis